MKDLRFFRESSLARARFSIGCWIETPTLGALMNVTDTHDLFDSDALLHIGRPYWFDKHPSQAEGEDF